MIRTRTRPAALAAALAAAATFAIATGPITPYAQAKPKSTSHDTLCAVLHDLANSDSDKASAAYQAGDKKTGDYYRAMADTDYKAAVAEGCAWTIWRVSGTGTVTPLGPVGIAPTP